MRRSFLQNGDGGGNILPAQSIIVRRQAALGDSLAASVVADRLKEMGYIVNWQTHPHVAPVMQRVPSVSSVLTYQTNADVNLDRAYEDHPRKTELHFHQLFYEAANRQLTAKGITLGPPVNCRPTLRVTTEERELAKQQLSQYPRPWVFICPGSQYYIVRTVPDHIWETAAKEINGTKFWIGLKDAPNGIVDLKCREVNQLIVMLSAADLLITPDTGPLHFAAAMGVQVLAIAQSSSPILHLSDLCDYETIGLGLDCENCQLTKCPKGEFAPPCQNQDPHQIARAANRKLNRGMVSCVIPTFNAPVERLAKCINAVLPQVDEVIVTAAADGQFPFGAPKHPKIRYVQSGRKELGFGKNCNHGIRHSSGSHILLLNDDAFLNPGCVKELIRSTGPNIGLVAHLLRYQSGRIYFAGRQRRNGERGCHHIDHNAWHPTYQQPTEMEAVSATSLLINREAFYRSKCFNERFFMYAEDDDISLRIRQHGYKIIYTPHATGIHEGNATSGPTGNMHRWIQESGKLMEELWGKYWDHNRNKVPGTFDYH